MTNQSTPTINHFSALITVENLTDDIEDINKCGEYIVKHLNLHVVKKIHHAFSPHGKTLLYVLSESHLSIHTWPEKNTLHIDLISCSKITESMVQRIFIEAFDRLIITDCLFKKHDF